MKSENPSLYFPNLDSLRFLAAFSVLFGHAWGFMVDSFGKPSFLIQQQTGEWSMTGKYLNQFLANYTVGVDIFFIISGFLITRLLMAEKERTGTIGIKNFYIRRILRIWPLYYLILIFSYFFTKYWTHEALPDYWPHIFFLGNFKMIHMNAWGTGKIFMLWSLCIEEHFYLVIPLLLYLCPVKKLPYAFLAIIALSILSRAWMMYHYQYPWFPIFLHTLSRCDVLAVGGLLAFFHYNSFQLKLPNLIRLMLLVYLILYFSLVSINYFDSFYPAVFGKYLYILPIALLFYDYVMSLSYQMNEKKWFVFNLLGKSSYSIYMFNTFFIIVAAELYWKGVLHSRLLFLPIACSMVILVSLGSYYGVERQFLRLKSKFL